MPRPIVTPWLRSIYESAAVMATPSDGAATAPQREGVVASKRRRLRDRGSPPHPETDAIMHWWHAGMPNALLCDCFELSNGRLANVIFKARVAGDPRAVERSKNRLAAEAERRRLRQAWIDAGEPLPGEEGRQTVAAACSLDHHTAEQHVLHAPFSHGAST
jgi:hypothetical protein